MPAAKKKPRKRMPAARKTPRRGLTANMLTAEPYHALVARLMQYRLDFDIQDLEKHRKKGRILGFVRGLRFAAQLIYALETALSDKDVVISWGHLLDKEGTLCSPECDIVIHKPGHVMQWNGGQSPVMNFKFITCTNALAVISCKSWMTRIDKKYAKDLKAYCSKVILFSECCPTKSFKTLRTAALRASYTGFWTLYTLDPRSGTQRTNEADWLKFIAAMRSACS